MDANGCPLALGMDGKSPQVDWSVSMDGSVIRFEAADVARVSSDLKPELLDTLSVRTA